jgi:hypothetical protein
MISGCVGPGGVTLVVVDGVVSTGVEIVVEEEDTPTQ